MLLLLQAIAGIVAICAEFGIGITGQRDVAKAAPHSRVGVVRRAWSAQIVAALLAGSLALFGGLVLVGDDRITMLGLALAILTGMVDGANPTWAFKGVERASIVASTEVVGRGLYVALVLTALDAYSTPEFVLACGLAGSLMSLGGTLAAGVRVKLISTPGLQGVPEQLHDAIPLMLLRVGGLVYNQLTLVLLGILTPVTVFAGVGGAVRLVTAVRAVGTPLVEAPFARMAAATDARTRARIQWQSQAIIAALMIPATIVLAEAHWLATIALGAEVAVAAAEYLRALALVPWLGASAVSVGFGFLVAAGQQKRFAIMSIIAGAGVQLGILVGWIYNASGWGAVIAMNLVQAVLLITILGNHRRS